MFALGFVLLIAAVLGLIVAIVLLGRKIETALDWCTARVGEAKKREEDERLRARYDRRRAEIRIAELERQLLHMKREGFAVQPPDVGREPRTWRITNEDEVRIDRARKAAAAISAERSRDPVRSLADEVLDDMEASETEAD